MASLASIVILAEELLGTTDVSLFEVLEIIVVILKQGICHFKAFKALGYGYVIGMFDSFSALGIGKIKVLHAWQFLPLLICAQFLFERDLDLFFVLTLILLLIHLLISFEVA